MKKYSVKFDGGKFFVGFSKSGNGTIWATTEQGTGCTPTFWDLYRALSKIQETEDVFHASRDGEVWSPTAGWCRENLLQYEEEAPWRIIHRTGMSGCEDFTLTKLVPGSKFGAERKIFSVHLSMMGKLNQGLHAPVPFLEHLASELPSPTTDGWVEVRELPAEDGREWRSGGLV